MYSSWNLAALSMSQRPTVPKLQAISPPSTVITTSVTTRVASSASSAGILACKTRCSGHTMAMTKIENATGARIERAKYSAARTSTVVQSPSMTRAGRLVMPASSGSMCAVGGLSCAENDPKTDPSTITATSAMIAPTIATMTMSK